MVSSLFVVTGASRGLGREVAVMFGRRTEALKQAKPFFVLLARGAEGLKATKEQILNVSPDAEVLTQSVDLSKVPECSNTLREAIATISSGQTFDNAILVNNAGIIKPLTPVLQIEPVDFMESFSLSVLGPLELLKAFNKVNSQKKTVVNISSIMALAPRDSCGVYSTVKAASDAMHRYEPILCCSRIHEIRNLILLRPSGVWQKRNQKPTGWSITLRY
mmetsp:Transcript_30965/g.118798  ORF Transcript_30965/g.118798 Transcript_30965/m.118798 type:complete len:219 (+) Transcript_30965:3751-4407(+)